MNKRIRNKKAKYAYPYPMKHVYLNHGAVASVSGKVTPEAINMLQYLVEIAYHTK